MPSLPQAFSWWCYANRGVDEKTLLATAKRIGYQGVDLIDEKWWPMAKDAGLKITAIAAHGTIENGLNDERNADRIEKEILENIEKAAKWHIPILVCFSGNRTGESDARGLENCVKTLSKVVKAAELAGVTLAMELLNSKVDHKNYQCDHTAWGVELCKKVGSPSFKLLYDIYHMQIMEGDIIRTIQDYHPYFAHYHTAGNPGRSQPDETQEMFYPAIYRAIQKTGYKGFVSHEFLPPEGVSPTDALAKAFQQLELA